MKQGDGPHRCFTQSNAARILLVALPDAMKRLVIFHACSS
jgi:hypothetical protein